jgi:hypothetical protein
MSYPPLQQNRHTPRCANAGKPLVCAKRKHKDCTNPSANHSYANV